MRKILSFLFVFLLLCSCQSREEKVAELIKQEMFKTLYDFESYEPIETKIDSAFTSIYTDSIIKSYAYIARAFLDDVEENLDKIKDDRNTMEIWSDSYSSLGRSKYNEALKNYGERLDKTKRYMEVVNNYMDSIKIISSNFKPEFYGWKASHKFRCKNKGGNFDLGNYIYVFDKKMNSIIYKEDIDDDSNNKIRNIIDEAINSKDEGSANANIEENQNSTADSLVSALKGNI
ncbi:hypothetical protein AAH084_22135 [Bacteroides faecis]|jgi:hypothetical protein|uniref:hypothetical protein n=1 Tax=Bacteroides faecis TaxID=674529 RepID=UPI0039B563AB